MSRAYFIEPHTAVTFLHNDKQTLIVFKAARRVGSAWHGVRRTKITVLRSKGGHDGLSQVLGALSWMRDKVNRARKRRSWHGEAKQILADFSEYGLYDYHTGRTIGGRRDDDDDYEYYDD